MENAAAGRDDAFAACAPGLVELARDHPLVKDFAQVTAEWIRLVAAVAETQGLTILHYDADFELVASVTGQPHEWVVARGTAD